ncbi:hypothetical protein AB2L28_20535 [Kineococcus sp. TBRC 1896]|uniref:Uncharacterized protein n=1 Tax=Kineococcus mangrovi TaxID=1660183 RepID=A0ABV4I7W8_9ACTN
MSPVLGWTLVVLFALVMAGVVFGTIRLATFLVDRTIRRELAPLVADLHALRSQVKDLRRS